MQHQQQHHSTFGRGFLRQLLTVSVPGHAIAKVTLCNRERQAQYGHASNPGHVSIRGSRQSEIEPVVSWHARLLRNS
jgi:hypothetical protein